MISFSSLADSANHHVLATSFNWILVISTWFSLGTRVAFRRSVMFTSHCYASRASPCSKRLPAVISWNPTCCLASAPGVQPIILVWDLRLFLLVFHPILQKLSQINTSSIRATLRRSRTVMISPSFHIRVGLRITRNLSMKRWENFRIQGKNYQEKIDNFALIVGLYNHDSCILVANFFTINLPAGCTEDVRA